MKYAFLLSTACIYPYLGRFNQILNFFYLDVIVQRVMGMMQIEGNTFFKKKIEYLMYGYKILFTGMIDDFKMRHIVAPKIEIWINFNNEACADSILISDRNSPEEYKLEHFLKFTAGLSFDYSDLD